MTSIPSQWKWVFNATYSKAIVLKSKNVLWNFFFIFVIYIKFGILWKKRWDSEVINFRNYRLEKAGFFKCLKSQVSEQLWTVNMLKCPKDCINLHGSIFGIFFDHSERISSRNSVLLLYEILRLFVYILTPDDKYSLSVKASV